MGAHTADCEHRTAASMSTGMHGMGTYLSDLPLPYTWVLGTVSTSSETVLVITTHILASVNPLQGWRSQGR
jgi:sugar phosphate permease